jgi:pilus assembly protein FimV
MFDSDALAASLRTPDANADAASAATADTAADPEGASANPAIADAIMAPQAATAAPAPAAAADAPAPAARTETPVWHSGWVQTEPASPPKPVPPPAQPRFVPLAEPAAAAQPKASIEHRMKLARAFLDIGDDHSAKQLLREVLDDVDPAAREEAARMLRELD